MASGDWFPEYQQQPVWGPTTTGSTTVEFVPQGFRPAPRGPARSAATRDASGSGVPSVVIAERSVAINGNGPLPQGMLAGQYSGTSYVDVALDTTAGDPKPWSADTQQPTKPPHALPYDEKAGPRAVLSALGLCCLVGIVGFVMLIAFAARSGETDHSCTGTCEIDMNTYERLCIDGDGCCAETVYKGIVMEGTCTGRSKLLLTMGLLCVCLFALTCCCASWRFLSKRDPSGTQPFSPNDLLAFFGLPPNPPATDAENASSQPPPEAPPSTFPQPQLQQDQDRPATGKDPTAREVLHVAGDASGAANGVFRLGTGLRCDFPYWKAEDGRVLASNSTGSWCIERDGILLAQSVSHQGRYPDELIEPMVWQVAVDRAWQPIKKLRITEGYTQGQKLEVRLDDAHVKPERWVPCEIVEPIERPPRDGEPTADLLTYRIRVLPTEKHAAADGLSGETLGVAVGGDILRKSRGFGETRCGGAVMRNGARGAAPCFEAKNVFVRVLDAPGIAEDSCVGLVVVKGVTVAEAMAAVLDRLGAGESPDVDPSQAWSVFKEDHYGPGGHLPVRFSHADLEEGAKYVFTPNPAFPRLLTPSKRDSYPSYQSASSYGGDADTVQAFDFTGGSAGNTHMAMPGKARRTRMRTGQKDHNPSHHHPHPTDSQPERTPTKALHSAGLGSRLAPTGSVSSVSAAVHSEPEQPQQQPVKALPAHSSSRSSSASGTSGGGSAAAERRDKVMAVQARIQELMKKQNAAATQ
eukprot:gene7796-11984_t